MTSAMFYTLQNELLNKELQIHQNTQASDLKVENKSSQNLLEFGDTTSILEKDEDNRIQKTFAFKRKAVSKLENTYLKKVNKALETRVQSPHEVIIHIKILINKNLVKLYIWIIMRLFNFKKNERLL